MADYDNRYRHKWFWEGCGQITLTAQLSWLMVIICLVLLLPIAVSEDNCPMKYNNTQDCCICNLIAPNKSCVQKCPTQHYSEVNVQNVNETNCNLTNSSSVTATDVGNTTNQENEQSNAEHLQPLSGLNQCVKCHSNCKECTGQQETDCTECPDGSYQLDSNIAMSSPVYSSTTDIDMSSTQNQTNPTASESTVHNRLESSSPSSSTSSPINISTTTTTTITMTTVGKPKFQCVRQCPFPLYHNDIDKTCQVDLTCIEPKIRNETSRKCVPCPSNCILNDPRFNTKTHCFGMLYVNESACKTCKISKEGYCMPLYMNGSDKCFTERHNATSSPCTIPVSTTKTTANPQNLQNLHEMEWYIIAAPAGGGTVLIIAIVAVIAVCYRKRRDDDEETLGVVSPPSIDDLHDTTTRTTKQKMLKNKLVRNSELQETRNTLGDKTRYTPDPHRKALPAEPPEEDHPYEPYNAETDIRQQQLIGTQGGSGVKYENVPKEVRQMMQKYIKGDDDLQPGMYETPVETQSRQATQQTLEERSAQTKLGQSLKDALLKRKAQELEPAIYGNEMELKEIQEPPIYGNEEPTIYGNDEVPGIYGNELRTDDVELPIYGNEEEPGIYGNELNLNAGTRNKPLTTVTNNTFNTKNTAKCTKEMKSLPAEPRAEAEAEVEVITEDTYYLDMTPSSSSNTQSSAHLLPQQIQPIKSKPKQSGNHGKINEPNMKPLPKEPDTDTSGDVYYLDMDPSDTVEKPNYTNNPELEPTIYENKEQEPLYENYVISQMHGKK